MNLYEKLAHIEEEITKQFDDEKYSLDAFEEMTFEIPNLNEIPESMMEQTPLSEFQKRIKDVMDESGFDYKLEFVSLTATAEGECYEPCYCLCWYDNGIHTKVFHFETVY